VGLAEAAVAAAVAGLLVGSPAAAQPTGPVTDVGPVAPDELHVMSFNLRFASSTPPNSWPERRPVMRKLLRDERPDIIGTQEGLFEQLRDIQADLPSYYDSLGQGRDGGSEGEAMQIFYDSRRLDVLEYNHYWLSDTPDVVGSKTWGGCCPRMVTWIRFLDTRTEMEFYLANTHFEAFDADARRMSAELMMARMDEEFDPDLPVIVTGDFNAPAGAGQTVFDLLVTDGPLADTWQEAAARSALYATFHGYRPLVPDGDRIDWILTSPEVTTRVAFINTYQQKGQFPSDHLPVQAVLRLPGTPGLLGLVG
jgi:endonuclease/exonuclease/phosphatase family metal-dependent hydrolase